MTFSDNDDGFDASGVAQDTGTLLLRAMRQAILRLDVSADNPPAIDCRAFLMLLAAGARRKLRVAPLEVGAPTVDERHIIELVAAAQAGDRRRLDLHLTTLVVPGWRDAVRAAVADLAEAMVEWAPPIRPAVSAQERHPNRAPLTSGKNASRRA